MRWNYTEPDPQIILNDGKKLSIYTKKDHQLIVTSAAELNNDITYAFFSGKSDLTNDFVTEPPDNRYDFTLAGTSLHTLRLIPNKPHPQIKAVQIWFDENFLIHHLILENHFDSTTQLTFTNIQTNSINVEDPVQIQAILKLNVPTDTEIIRQ
jgi:outer membrane lipoprotein-sorting protein